MQLGEVRQVSVVKPGRNAPGDSGSPPGLVLRSKEALQRVGRCNWLWQNHDEERVSGCVNYTVYLPPRYTSSSRTCIRLRSSSGVAPRRGP